MKNIVVAKDKLKLALENLYEAAFYGSLETKNVRVLEVLEDLENSGGEDVRPVRKTIVKKSWHDLVDSQGGTQPNPMEDFSWLDVFSSAPSNQPSPNLGMHHTISISSLGLPSTVMSDSSGEIAANPSPESGQNLPSAPADWHDDGYEDWVHNDDSSL